MESWLLVIGVIFVMAGQGFALFEDQAFKFDWRQQYLGEANDANFWETSSGAGVILRTASNVLACIDADSGAIKWRHIFTDSQILDIHLEGKHLTTITRSVNSETDFSLSVWKSDTGTLISEQRVTNPMTSLHTAFTHNGKSANLVTLTPEGSVKVNSFDIKKGNLINTFSYSTGATDVSCTNLDTALICLSPSLQMVYYTSLPLVKGGSFNAVPLQGLIEPAERPTALNQGTNRKAIVRLVGSEGQQNSLVLTFDEAGKFVGSNVFRGSSPGSNFLIAGCKNSDDIFLIEQECSEKSVVSRCSKYSPQVKVMSIKSRHEMQFTAKVERGAVVASWASCDATSDDPNYQLILKYEDASLTSVTPLGNLMWSRDDGLADIAAVQLVSIGLHAKDGSEDEDEEMSRLDLAGVIYDGLHERDAVSQLLRRLKFHVLYLQSVISHLLSFKDVSHLLDSKDTSPDDFGIRKVIVTATSHGKLYGIDSLTGKILWHTLFGGKPFKNLAEQLYLFVQRSSHHYGFDARCALIYNNEASNLPELVQFNPLNGKVIESKKLLRKLQQAVLMHHSGADFLKPILMLYEGLAVELVPASAAKDVVSLSGKVFLAVPDIKTRDRILGNRLVITKDGELNLSPVWTFNSPGSKIVRVVSKPTDEVVHSQGRVMADRSVLFKYINPNLGLILTEGKDSSSKTFINVYLIDLVTGRVVFSTSHKRVVGPYHIVHSENWAIYSYFNEKARRGELISLELFEGTTQSNATIFSSLHNQVTPMVERQAFILGPSYVTAMKDTVTDKGITTKHILMATTAGSVYDVSRFLLDPRRPTMSTPAEMREPGLPPYIPELNFPPEFVLNYNQSLAQPRGIFAAPTDLESTSVIFVHGLDLYCTRVTPSKGFDLLKEDFDYLVISSVLAALIAASLATRKFSQMKNLKLAWR